MRRLSRHYRRFVGHASHAAAAARAGVPELLAMILGFVVFWPIGLTILFLKIWQKREGRPIRIW